MGRTTGQSDEDELDVFVVDEDDDPLPEESDDEDELFVDDEPASDDELLDESEEELESPAGVVVLDFPRLSFLKKPDPLNVTPTGWKTFFTAMVSPVSGWVYSVSVSSVNAWWTSIVSPVSTNL